MATTNPNGVLATAAQFDPSNYSAAKATEMAGPMQSAESWTPDDSAMVSSQLTRLLSGNSDYMSRARSKAMEYSNSRGLLNSSLAATAGEAAAIDAALPIAQQDASTHATAQKGNVDTRNNFALDANRFGREGALAAVGAGFDVFKQGQQNQFAAGESALDRAARADEFGRDLSFRQNSFGQEIGLKRDTLAADTSLRDRDLALRTTAEANDARLREGDLALRTTSEANDARLRGEDLALRRDVERNTNSGRQAELQAELQRTYMDARLQLETSPNLDAAAKANAINAMSEWFYSSALPQVRAALGDPNAWPDLPSSTPSGAAVSAPEKTIQPVQIDQNSWLGA